jgi:hypothetical protein
VSTGLGWARPWQHCYLEGATSLFYQLLKVKIGLIDQAPPNSSKVSMFHCLSFDLATCCPKLLIGCSSTCFQGYETESSLCFEEVEVKYTFTFYCDLLSTPFC